jgi:predicted methyltransferase
LNRSFATAFVDEEGLHLCEEEMVPWDNLIRIAKDENGCFAVEGGEIRKIQAFSELTGRAYSLFPTAGAPTMRVAGFPMHRIKDCLPEEDTKRKIATVGKIHGAVLDICTGLGYTAIHAAWQAEAVTTIELDPLALDICRQNPWSQELFENAGITSLVGDAFNLIEGLPASCFKCIFHDPPTLQLAGELYSGEMYARIRRVLKRGGKLFHYIGDPESPFGRSTTQGVIKRLKEAGFGFVERHAEAFGIVAW